MYKIKTGKEYQMLKWFLFNLLLLVVCINGGISWDTYDDPVMALILLRYGAENTPFSNQLYLRLFDVLYEIFPQYNWWLIISIAEILVAFNIYIYILMKLGKKAAERKFYCFFFVLSTYYFVLRQVNFTRTACYVANAGLILFVLSKEMECKWKVCNAAIGVFLYMIGAGIRLESALMVIPAACLMILYHGHLMLRQRIMRMAAMIIMFGTICMILELTNQAVMSADMSEWNSALSYKRTLSDYPVRFRQDANIEALSAAGILPSDIEFVKGASFTYKNVFNNENLKLLCDSVEVSLDIKFLYNEICLSMKYSSMIWFFILGVLLMKRKRKVLIMYVVLMALMESALMLLGRCPLRVFDSILFVGTMNGICCSCLVTEKECFGVRDFWDHAALILCAGLAVLLIVRGNVNNLIDTDLYRYTHKMTKEELDEIDFDKEHIYVMSSDKFVALAIPDNIFLNYDIAYCDNMLYQEGFFSDLPIFDEILQTYHVKDAVELMYSSQDVYSAYNEKLIVFLEEHGCRLRIVERGMIGNTKIVQYSRS